MNKEIKKIYKDAFIKWGANLQLNLLIEEASEVIYAVCKLKRDSCTTNFNKLAEEIADIRIVLEQIECMFELTRKIREARDFKLERLKKRLL